MRRTSSAVAWGSPSDNAHRHLSIHWSNLRNFSDEFFLTIVVTSSISLSMKNAQCSVRIISERGMYSVFRPRSIAVEHERRSIGLLTARTLVEEGAKSVVLLSRSGKPAADAVEQWEWLQSTSAKARSIPPADRICVSHNRGFFLDEFSSVQPLVGCTRTPKQEV